MLHEAGGRAEFDAPLAHAPYFGLRAAHVAQLTQRDQAIADGQEQFRLGPTMVNVRAYIARFGFTGTEAHTPSANP